jgi:hypothetical protein
MGLGMERLQQLTLALPPMPGVFPDYPGTRYPQYGRGHKLRRFPRHSVMRC